MTEKWIFVKISSLKAHCSFKILGTRLVKSNCIVQRSTLLLLNMLLFRRHNYILMKIALHITLLDWKMDKLQTIQILKYYYGCPLFSPLSYFLPRRQLKLLLNVSPLVSLALNNKWVIWVCYVWAPLHSFYILTRSPRQNIM